jgi:hypothetical protein
MNTVNHALARIASLTLVALFLAMQIAGCSDDAPPQPGQPFDNAGVEVLPATDVREHLTKSEDVPPPVSDAAIQKTIQESLQKKLPEIETVDQPLPKTQCAAFCATACEPLVSCGNILPDTLEECKQNCPQICEAGQISMHWITCLSQKLACKDLKACLAKSIVPKELSVTESEPAELPDIGSDQETPPKTNSGQ